MKAVSLLWFIIFLLSIAFSQPNKFFRDIKTGECRPEVDNEKFITEHRREKIMNNDLLSRQEEHLMNAYLPENKGNPTFGMLQNSYLTDNVHEAWINHYASGLMPGIDEITYMTTDDQSNVYVTGTSMDSLTYNDYATIKYNSLGQIQWIARYNGPGNSNDEATAVVVDSEGNVYVTGYSESSESNKDYTTVKYNSSGIEQWVACYNGPGNGTDKAYSLALDDEGNVYVSGYSHDSETSYDYATIKYNSLGEKQWTARYNGPGNGIDRAYSLSVDNIGNVYVAGDSKGAETGYDYTLVKYNTSGEEQWVARYNGTGNGDNSACSMVIDDQGNVYVTGECRNSGTSKDYGTVKYNSSGVEQWVACYNGPGTTDDRATAIIVDDSGNVYVTGYSLSTETYYDYATVKYNSLGVGQWVERYNGPKNYIDRAYAIAVDDTGNVYVTGYSYGSFSSSDYATVKYNSSGAEQWVMRYDGLGNSYDEAYAIVLDNQGNIYVAGGSIGSETGYDYATIKYNSLGEELHTMRYDGPGQSEDRAYVLAMDDQGNVYVTGSSECPGTGVDYITVKYNSLGTEQWFARFNGSGNGSDVANALTVDCQGNVYVTGSSNGSETSSDYSTIKYNSLGVEQWVARYNGPKNSYDHAYALAVDNHGNVYVTGYSKGLETDYDYATIKYNSSGVEQWVSRYNGPANKSDWAKSLTIDDQSNVYVTGNCQGPSSNSDYATIKYDSSGDEQWVACYNGTSNNSDYANAIVVDNQGNVYVTGGAKGSGTNDDYTTIKYDSSGVEQWVARYDGPVNGSDVASAIAIDAFGNIYVTGYSYGSVFYTDYATVKYDPTGVEQWVMRYNGLGDAHDKANSLAVDYQGNVYVCGYSDGVGTSCDYTTVKYDSLGIKEWVARYNSPDDDSDIAVGLKLDNHGNVYVTGHNLGKDRSIITTIKYSQTATSLEREMVNAAVKYKLNQNYPNPFNPITTIRYAIPIASKVKIEIFNLLGQRIEVLVNKHKSAGSYTVQFDANSLPSGMYLYRIKAGDFLKIRKMLLVK